MLLAASLGAQSNGSISGVAKDSQGGAIQGAAITAGDAALGVSQTTKSADDGAFVFPQLPPGTYTLTIEAAGFKKSEKSEVVLPVLTRFGFHRYGLRQGADG